MNKNVLTIYQASIEDIENIIEIEIESHQSSSGQLDRLLNEMFLAEYKKRWLKKMNDGMHTLIISLDNRLAGFINFILDKQRAEIQNIYIVTELRGKGIGRTLCSHAISRMLKKGAKEILVWLVEGRRKIKNFYEQMGFLPSMNVRLDKITDELTLVERKFFYKAG